MSDANGDPEDKSAKKPGSVDCAFDSWLNRGLHEIFDEVMNEPIPPELLKILKDDEKK